MGDFNIDFLRSVGNNNASNFYSSLQSYFYTPFILQPTRLRSKTLIDNIFSIHLIIIPTAKIYYLSSPIIYLNFSSWKVILKSVPYQILRCIRKISKISLTANLRRWLSMGLTGRKFVCYSSEMLVHHLNRFTIQLTFTWTKWHLIMKFRKEN